MAIEENKLMRRVAGYHDIRMDGMTDLVMRANGRTVLDIGCNRGLVGFEFANNGARLVHGCDNYESGIATARELFIDLRNCKSQFECVDLTNGSSSLDPFGNGQYDIVLLLATYHKLKRAMTRPQLTSLVRHLGMRTSKWLGWRGTSEKANENEEEMRQLDIDLGDVSLKRIHTSYLSETLGVCAIWKRS